MKKLLIKVIRGYQLLISPMLGTRCRFYPTCSVYAMEAIEKKGFFIGSWSAIQRLAKCHPFHLGGHDPVSTVERASRIIPTFLYLFAYKAATALPLGIILLSLENKT